MVESLVCTTALAVKEGGSGRGVIATRCVYLFCYKHFLSQYHFTNENSIKAQQYLNLYVFKPKLGLSPSSCSNCCNYLTLGVTGMGPLFANALYPGV